MNDDNRRRRRLDDGEGNGWLSMIALIVVVVLVGLLLGAVLARVFGAKTTVVVSPSPLPTLEVTQEPSLTPLPSGSAAPTDSPSPSPSPAPIPAATAAPATATPKALPAARKPATPAPTASPTPLPTRTATPVAPVKATPKPHPKHAVVTPHAVATTGAQTPSARAAEVVRLYLEALAHGDTAQARSYLSSGNPSESSFMDSSAHITSIRTSRNPDGTYKVDADLTTSSGEYYITFVVIDNVAGDVIADHIAIKP